MINFVTFHVNFNEKSGAYLNNSAVLVKENILTKLMSGKEDFHYVDMISTMFKSARLFHPGCRCVVLTDAETDFLPIEALAEIRRYDIDPRRIILSRLIAQIDYLKNYAGNDDILFIDSDIILNANLDHVFDQAFDIAVTYRPSKKDMPVNGGMLFVSMRRKDRALAFFERVYDTYMSKYVSNDVWWGDQFALRDVIKVKDFAANTVLDVDGIKVLFLSCNEYNFKPAESHRAILFALEGKKAIHFQGRRKKIMRLYWEIYLAGRHERSINLLLLAIKNRIVLLASLVKEICSGDFPFSYYVTGTMKSRRKG